MSKPTPVKAKKSSRSAPTKRKPEVPTVRESSKQTKLIAMLKGPAGATIDQMAKAFGWQKHTVRGVMSGVLKKKLDLKIVSTDAEDGRVYRIA